MQIIKILDTMVPIITPLIPIKLTKINEIKKLIIASKIGKLVSS